MRRPPRGLGRSPAGERDLALSLSASVVIEVAAKRRLPDEGATPRIGEILKMIQLAVQTIDASVPKHPYHHRLIMEHPFSTKVSIVATGDAAEALDPASLSPELGSNLAMEILLADLLNIPFLEFINEHHTQMVMLSQHPQCPNLEAENTVFGIDNEGRLWMHMSQSFYRHFGLVGHALDKKEERFIVQVDLKVESLGKEDSKSRTRHILCISTLFPGLAKVTFAFASSSLAATFANSLPHLLPSARNPTSAIPRLTLKNLDSVFVPNFPMLDSHVDGWMELDQWLGLIVHDCTTVLTGQRVDPFISTCTFDETSATKQPVHILTIDAPLVHPATILGIFDGVLRKNNVKDMLGLNVIGEPLSPVTWGACPNRSDAMGRTAHGYSVILHRPTNTEVAYQYSSTSLNNKPSK